MRPVTLKPNAPASLTRVLTDNEKWFLLGDTEGAICTKEQYSAFAINPAHLFDDGRIMSYLECVGGVEHIDIGPDDGE